MKLNLHNDESSPRPWHQDQCGSLYLQRRRRAQDRLSSADRNRLLEKFVRDLEYKRASLQQENSELRKILEAHLAKRRQLLCLLEQETNCPVMDHSRFLRRMLQRHQSQEQQHARIAVHQSISHASHESLIPCSHSFFKHGQGMRRRDPIHGHSAINGRHRLESAISHLSYESFSALSHESLLSSRTVLEQEQGQMQSISLTELAEDDIVVAVPTNENHLEEELQAKRGKLP